MPAPCPPPLAALRSRQCNAISSQPGRQDRHNRPAQAGRSELSAHGAGTVLGEGGPRRPPAKATQPARDGAGSFTTGQPLPCSQEATASSNGPLGMELSCHPRNKPTLPNGTPGRAHGFGTTGLFPKLAARLTPLPAHSRPAPQPRPSSLPPPAGDGPSRWRLEPLRARAARGGAEATPSPRLSPAPQAQSDPRGMAPTRPAPGPRGRASPLAPGGGVSSPDERRGSHLRAESAGRWGWGRPYVQFLEKEGRQTLALAHHIWRFWKTNLTPDSKASGTHRGGPERHDKQAPTRLEAEPVPSLPAGSHPPPPASVGPAPRRPRPSAQGQLSPRGCRPQRAGHKVPGTPRTERTRSWARQPVATGLRLCTPSGGLCPPLPPPRAAGTPGPIHSAAGSRVLHS